MSNSIKDALKKLCLKVTGKKSAKESINGVIDDITGNYKNGSEVIANPPVSQNAKKLTSVSIDGEKYKIDSGGSDIHLYAHDIYFMYYAASGYTVYQVYTKIISSSPTLFTYDSLIQYVSRNNYRLMATGYFSDASSNALNNDRLIADSLVVEFGQLYVYGARETELNGKQIYSGHKKRIAVASSDITFNDTVIQII